MFTHSPSLPLRELLPCDGKKFFAAVHDSGLGGEGRGTTAAAPRFHLKQRKVEAAVVVIVAAFRPLPVTSPRL